MGLALGMYYLRSTNMLLQMRVTWVPIYTIIVSAQIDILKCIKWLKKSSNERQMCMELVCKDLELRPKKLSMLMKTIYVICSIPSYVLNFGHFFTPIFFC